MNDLPDPPDDLLDKTLVVGEIPAGDEGLRKAWELAQATGSGFEAWEFVCGNPGCGNSFIAIMHQQDQWVACGHCGCKLFCDPADRDRLRPEMLRRQRLRLFDS